MRRLFWSAFIVLVAAITAPSANADSLIDGNIQFTVTGGTIPVVPTGSFVYDATTNLFLHIVIEIDWQPAFIGFDLAPCANDEDSSGNIYCFQQSHPLTSYQALISCDGVTTTCSWRVALCDPDINCNDSFARLANGAWMISAFNLGSTPSTGDFATGTFTTPEPGSLLLLASGLLVVVGLFRRGPYSAVT